MKKFLLIFLIAISPLVLCAFKQKDFDKMIGFKIKPMQFYSTTEDYIKDLRKVLNKIPYITIVGEDLKIVNDLKIDEALIKPYQIKYLDFPIMKSYNKLNYTLYKDGNDRKIEFVSQSTPNGDVIIESHCVYDKEKSYHVYDSFYTIDKKVQAKGVSPHCNNYFKAFDYLFEKTFFNMYQSTGNTNAVKSIGASNRNGYNCDLYYIKNPNYVLGDESYNVEGFACVSERYGLFVDGELKYTSQNGIQTIMKHTITQINVSPISYEMFLKAPYTKKEKETFRMEI